nr:MAG TPA: hypothetical protein [Caudoviricetes sp.]
MCVLYASNRNKMQWHLRIIIQYLLVLFVFSPEIE